MESVEIYPLSAKPKEVPMEKYAVLLVGFDDDLQVGGEQGHSWKFVFTSSYRKNPNKSVGATFDSCMGVLMLQLGG